MYKVRVAICCVSAVLMTLCGFVCRLDQQNKTQTCDVGRWET